MEIWDISQYGIWESGENIIMNEVFSLWYDFRIQEIQEI